MYLVHHHTEINAARLASFTHSGLEIENYKYVNLNLDATVKCKIQFLIWILHEFRLDRQGNFTRLCDSLSIIWDFGPLWFKSQFFILLAAAVVVHRQAFFSDNAAMSASSHRIIMASASVERRRRPLLLLMKIIRVKCATPDEEQAAAAAAFVLMLVNHNGGHQRTKCLTRMEKWAYIHRNNHLWGVTSQVEAW